MGVALVDDGEDVLFCLVAATQLIHIGQQVDLLLFVSVNEVGHLVLPDNVHYRVLLVFRHNELEEVHVLATQNRHLLLKEIIVI